MRLDCLQHRLPDDDDNKAYAVVGRSDRKNVETATTTTTEDLSTQAPRACALLLVLAITIHNNTHGRQKKVTHCTDGVGRKMGERESFGGDFFSPPPRDVPTTAGIFVMSMACCIECDGGAPRHDDVSLGWTYYFYLHDLRFTDLILPARCRAYAFGGLLCFVYLPVTYPQRIPSLIEA